MEAVDIFWITFLSFLPISELRGGIPYAIANGFDWRFAYAYAAAINALVPPVCWIFLSTFHKLFLKMHWYEKLFNRFVDRARSRVHKGVERWGWLGIALFVAIPLPITGAWTGTLGAWILGLSKRKTMLAVIVGVIISGAIVTTVMVAGLSAFSVFIKRV